MSESIDRKKELYEKIKSSAPATVAIGESYQFNPSPAISAEENLKLMFDFLKTLDLDKTEGWAILLQCSVSDSHKQEVFEAMKKVEEYKKLLPRIDQKDKLVPFSIDAKGRTIYMRECDLEVEEKPA
jgi:hypothetical protein